MKKITAQKFVELENLTPGDFNLLGMVVLAEFSRVLAGNSHAKLRCCGKGSETIPPYPHHHGLPHHHHPSSLAARTFRMIRTRRTAAAMVIAASTHHVIVRSRPQALALLQYR